MQLYRDGKRTSSVRNLTVPSPVMAQKTCLDAAHDLAEAAFRGRA